MTERDLSYFAGIVDGEGCINITYSKSRKTYAVRITIMNTSKELMDWIVLKVGGKYNSRKKYKNHWKQRWQWCLYSYKPQKELIKQLVKRLVIKKKQAIIALGFIETIRGRGHKIDRKTKMIRHGFWNEMKRLNLRGTGGERLSD